MIVLSVGLVVATRIHFIAWQEVLVTNCHIKLIT